jgi:cytochrome c
VIRRMLKWTAVVILVAVAAAFLAFLYFIPPFFTTPPEKFGKDVADAAPQVTDIADGAERAIARRGRYLVVTAGCIGCHATNGPQGPDLTKYLAGGGLKIATPRGTFVSRNLTPDKDTGLARRTDAEVKRVLRSGVFPDGHVTSFTVMPWAAFSNWTEEDRHAVVVYLRHLKPVKHQIPEPTMANAITVAGALEQDYGVKDYGVAPN